MTPSPVEGERLEWGWKDQLRSWHFATARLNSGCTGSRLAQKRGPWIPACAGTTEAIADAWRVLLMETTDSRLTA